MKSIVAVVGLVAQSLVPALPALADHRDSRIELSCYEVADDADRGWHYVEIAEDGGRLVASVYLAGQSGEGRLLKRAGVARREAPGRELDVLYVGRDLKVSVASESGAGLLELTQLGRTRRVPLECE